MVEDITDRRQAYDQRSLVIAELQHRVRNIFGVVRSVVSRTLSNARPLDELAAHLKDRIDALGRVHAVISRSVEDGVDLEELVRDELMSLAGADVQVRVRGPAVRLTRLAAESLGLVLHELGANAVKFGALAEHSGRVTVDWNVVDSSRGASLVLEWQESGVRLMDPQPRRSGFGRELIERALPYEMGAATSLEFARGGVRVVIELPLNDKVGHKAP